MQKDGSDAVLLEEAVPAAVFRAEVMTWARRIGVEPKEIRLRPMKRKWASCSSAGRLTFDTGLLRQPAPFRAEAVAHELLHLKLPNHGRVFRALLRSYIGTEGSRSNQVPYARRPRITGPRNLRHRVRL